MDNFYDVNDFIVFLFKKWRVVLVVIILGVAVFTGNRAVSMIGSYMSQDETSEAEVSPVTDPDSTEPMWIKIQNIIKITPGQDENSGPTAEQIIEAYRKLCRSSSVLDTVSEEWYESEKEEYQNRIKKFHDYGYILDKELNYPYALRDFYTQFLINNDDINSASRTQYTYDERYIAVGFKSTDESLARNITNTYTETLTAAVQESIGEFTYEIVDESVLYDLPGASAGTQTTRVASSSSATASLITVNQIIVQCVKGVIWGIIIGAVISILLVFLMYMMTRKIYLLSDAKKFNVPILGMGFLKERGFLKIRSRFHTVLEGGNWDETGHKKLVKRIAETVEAIDSDKEVCVTGTCRVECLEKIAHELSEAASEIKIGFVEGIQESGKAAKIAGNENVSFILVERFGESLKDNIEYEVTELSKLEAEILGMIVLE